MTVGTTLRTTPTPTSAASFVTRTFRAMGTDVQIVLSADVDLIEPLLDYGQTRIEDLEQCLSRFRVDSELSQLNSHAGSQTIVSPTLFRFVSAARQAWEQSEGLFDPTQGHVLSALGYDRTFDDLAPVTQLAPLAPAGLKPSTNTPAWSRLVLDSIGPTVYGEPTTRLDLGGIAKGLSADVVSEELIERGASACCVNVGGDLRVRGTGPESDGTWMIGLECPGSAQRRSVWLKSGAVCTSTVTERRWESSEGPMHHVLDPETSRPAHSRVLSATVIGREAAACEVLATMAIVGGSTVANEKIVGAGATGLLVTNNGTMEHLPGVSRFLEGPLGPEGHP